MPPAPERHVTLRALGAMGARSRKDAAAALRRAYMFVSAAVEQRSAVARCSFAALYLFAAL